MNIESNITTEETTLYNNTEFYNTTTMNETANITELDNSPDYLVVAGITIFSFIGCILLFLLGIVGINVYQRKRGKRCSKTRRREVSEDIPLK